MHGLLLWSSKSFLLLLHSAPNLTFLLYRFYTLCLKSLSVPQVNEHIFDCNIVGAMRKYHRLISSLQTREVLCLSNLEAEKCEIQMAADLVSDKSPFLPVLSWVGSYPMGGAKELCLGSSVGTPTSFRNVLPSSTLLPQFPLFNPTTLGIKILMYEPECRCTETQQITGCQRPVLCIFWYFTQ